MGWDAYAVRPGIDPRESEEEFLTPGLRQHFHNASAEMANITGTASENLGTGTLGGLSMGILARATGMPDYDNTSADGGLLWTADEVKRACEQAHWDFRLADDDERATLLTEARLFLRVCASNGLAIWFDW